MEILCTENIQALKSLVHSATQIAVLGHTHPDGDALGVTAGMCLWLQQCGKESVTCVLPDTPATHLQFILPPSVRYLFHDQAPDRAAACIAEADLIILMDCNAFSRTEALQPHLEASHARKILIDHHLNPDRDAFDLVFSTPDISSASELLYWILKACSESGKDTLPAAFARTGSRSDAEGRVSFPDIAIGTALMIGMTTDTNNFANSVFPSTFRMASELIAAGVDRDALLQHIYQSYRENRVRLMGYMQYEGLHTLPCGAAYMIMTEEVLRRFDLHEGESEGLVNVPLTIADIRLSVLLKQEKDHFRVSVRSKKGTSAQQLAVRFFHGGGHENASGGKLHIGTDIPAAGDAAAYVENALNTFLA